MELTTPVSSAKVKNGGAPLPHCLHRMVLN
jgi:hypothetical protein